MTISNLVLFLFISMQAVIWKNTEKVFFQTPALSDIKLFHSKSLHTILDDKGKNRAILEVYDEKGILYWHSRLKTPVCLTGECKLIDIGIYWYSTGDFMGFEVYGEHLTKTDHSDFSLQDYERLEEILGNDWSKLREYELSDLVEEVFDEDPKVDGTSGATKKEIAAEAVEDAVYTTHTIWHLIHVGEKEQLMELTAKRLSRDALLFDNLLANDADYRYRAFILSLIAQDKIMNSTLVNSLVIEGLNHGNNPKVKSSAFKSLSKCDYSDTAFIEKLLPVFKNVPTEEKIQFLSEFQNVESIPHPLFNEIIKDFEFQQDWYVIKVLQMFKNDEQYKEEIRNSCIGFQNRDNPLLKSLLLEYLKEN